MDSPALSEPSSDQQETMAAAAETTTQTTAAGANATASTTTDLSADSLQLSTSDININMEDVFKAVSVMDDFGGEGNDAASSAAAAAVNDHVMPPPPPAQPFVDRVALADEKYTEVCAEQDRLEARYERMRRRAELLRSQFLSASVAEEISHAREFCRNAVPAPPPPPPPPPPPATKQPPKFTLQDLKPPPVLNNIPGGIRLPSVPSTEVLNGTTQSSSYGKASKVLSSPSSSVAVKVVKEESDAISPQVDVANDDDDEEEGGGGSSKLTEKKRTYDVLGQLESNLKHLMHSYDSEATESSSGGESCDETEDYPQDSAHYVPIKKRARWTYLKRRASIASRWTWLTAQISDLEYRIRQQTDIYRQIRTAKGPVTLGEPVVSWPSHAKKAVTGPALQPENDAPLNCKPVTKDYSRIDSTGRKIIIKEPSSPDKNGLSVMQQQQQEQTTTSDDNSFGACRTRPVKMIRRRRVLVTKELFRSQVRATKESTVRCDCLRPETWCAICYGKTNHTQLPEPVSQERNQCLSLLDHSYHQVLSTRDEVSLDARVMQKMRNKKWLLSTVNSLTSGARDGTAAGDGASLFANKKKLKRRDGEEGGVAGGGDRKRKKSKSVSLGGGNNGKTTVIKKLRRDKDGKIIKKLRLPNNRRRKSLTVSTFYDDRRSAINDLSGSDDDDDSEDPSSPANNHAWADHIRKRRETAYDIDNIVIPYSMAASTRVERIKYKEILTPNFRQVDTSQDTESAKVESSAADEDISEAVYEARHAKAEADEKRKWLMPSLYKSTGGQRSRSRRQDSVRTEASSGCNTPDPLSPVMVDTVEAGNSTRPSTPVGVDETPASAPSTPGTIERVAGSIRNRRRTSSVTKSRERNPSEDTQGSRCVSPESHVVFEIPFEARSFPLREDDFRRMKEEMPTPRVSISAQNGTTIASHDDESPVKDTARRHSLPTAGGDTTSPLKTTSNNRSRKLDSLPNSSDDEDDDDEIGEEEEEGDATEGDEDPDWKCDANEDDAEWDHTKSRANGNSSPSVQTSPVKIKKSVSTSGLATATKVSPKSN